MITVLIVHDNSILGAGLRMMLSTGLDLQVVGEADDETAAAMASELVPQVALIDADSCRAGGLVAIAALRARRPEMGIVVLGLHDDQETCAEVARAGACSFVSKQSPEKMLEEIRSLGRPSC